jgi:hypothetical protein
MSWLPKWPLIGRPRKAAGQPDRRQTMALAPLRNPTVAWSPPASAPVTIEIPLQRRPVARPLKWLASKLARREPPTVRRLELDPVGSFVWRAVDGTTTVRALIWRLAAEFKMNRRDAEASLLEFLSALSARNLLGFANMTAEAGGSQGPAADQQAD